MNEAESPSGRTQTACIASEAPTPSTPGPWAFQNDSEFPEQLHTIWKPTGPFSFGVLVARTCYAPRSEANARLIAAAPELLYACKELVRFITTDYSRESLAKGYWPSVGPIVDRMDAIIENAEGHKPLSSSSQSPTQSVAPAKQESVSSPSSTPAPEKPHSASAGTLTAMGAASESRQATRYGLAPNPVFWSIQGEAHLRGFQMCFIRLAGCSVGCPNCDTDYSKDSTATAEEIANMADAATPPNATDRWVWLTGGEPADLPQMKMRELLGSIAKKGFRIAVATSGVKPFIPPVDWLSVSPHSNGVLAQPYGNEIKLVMGLNGFDPDEFLATHSGIRFMYQYIQPLSIGGQEDADSLKRCLKWLESHPDWSLSRQDHHYWQKP